MIRDFLKMEAAWSFETSVTNDHTTRRNIPENNYDIYSYYLLTYPPNLYTGSSPPI